MHSHVSGNPTKACCTVFILPLISLYKLFRKEANPLQDTEFCWSQRQPQGGTLVQKDVSRVKSSCDVETKR